MLIKQFCMVFYLSLKMIVESHLFATIRVASPQKEIRSFLLSLREQQILPLYYGYLWQVY